GPPTLWPPSRGRPLTRPASPSCSARSPTASPPPATSPARTRWASPSLQPSNCEDLLLLCSSRSSQFGSDGGGAGEEALVVGQDGVPVVTLLHEAAAILAQLAAQGRIADQEVDDSLEFREPLVGQAAAAAPGLASQHLAPALD